jgi:hypothetical protein
MALVLWARQTAADIDRARAAGRAPAVPAPPLAFDLVAERFGQVEQGASRDQVEALIGPPTERWAWGPEVEEFERRWWNGGRNLFPADREWNRWSDPADPERWAAVAYIRRPTNEQTVYGRLKKGF